MLNLHRENESHVILNLIYYYYFLKLSKLIFLFFLVSPLYMETDQFGLKCDIINKVRHGFASMSILAAVASRRHPQARSPARLMLEIRRHLQNQILLKNFFFIHI